MTTESLLMKCHFAHGGLAIRFRFHGKNSTDVAADRAIAMADNFTGRTISIRVC
jgi:hypothetical protein